MEEVFWMRWVLDDLERSRLGSGPCSRGHDGCGTFVFGLEKGFELAETRVKKTPEQRLSWRTFPDNSEVCLN